MKSRSAAIADLDAMTNAVFAAMHEGEQILAHAICRQEKPRSGELCAGRSRRYRWMWCLNSRRRPLRT
jgi:hypothetical protein